MKDRDLKPENVTDALNAVYGVDPFLVPCPRCGQLAGDACLSLSAPLRGKSKQFPHPDRIDAAREAAAT